MRTLNLFLWIVNQAVPFENLYLIALILLLGLILFAGLRLNYPISLSLTITSLVMGLFVLGIHLFSFPVQLWGQVLFSGQNYSGHSLYLPGGIILAALGLFLFRKALHIKAAMLDTIVLGLPIIGILQRLDCFFTGCCYGRVSDLPWAVSYPSQSIAWNQQVNEHLLSSSAQSSLGVHPTQLYYIAGFLLTIGILLIMRSRLRRAGSLALLGFLLLGSLRWVIEFFREPFIERWYQFTFLGMNGLQYLLILLLVPAFVYLYSRERNFAGQQLSIPVESLRTSSLFLLLSAILIWNAGMLLSLMEYLLLVSLLITGISVVGFRLFTVHVSGNHRYAALGLLSFTLLTMSQSIPDTTVATMPQLSKKYLSIDIAAGGGKYDRIDRGCNGEEIGRTPAAYNSQSLGGSFNYIDGKGTHIRVGATAFRLYDKVLEEDYSHTTLYAVSPYFLADAKKVGFGFGMNLVPDGQKSFFPMFNLRVGNREKFFVDGNASRYFPYLGYSAIWQLGVGTGFGNYEKHNMRFGVSSMEGKALLYANGNFNLDEHITLSANLGLGNTVHGSLGLGYLIPLKTKGKANSTR